MKKTTRHTKKPLSTSFSFCFWEVLFSFFNKEREKNFFHYKEDKDKKENENFIDNFNIIEEKIYGISKVIFGNFL